MKRKNLLVIILSVILSCSLIIFCGCELFGEGSSSESNSSSVGEEGSSSSITDNSSSSSELPLTEIKDGITFILSRDKTYEVASFDGSKSLVSIPNTINGASVTTIGNKAFFECSSLESIEIPNSVKHVGFEAFSGCSGLKKVNYLGSVDEWVQVGFYPTSNPTLYANDLHINGELLTHAKISSAPEINECAFQNCQSLKTVEISKNVVSISDEAFENCSSLQSVTFEKGSRLETIGYAAFFECSSLTSIEIPNSVTKLGYSSFFGCELLESAIFEEDSCLETIDLFAFSNCSSLTSIKIPKSVRFIGACAFRKCTSLTSVTFENTSGWFVSKNSFATSGTNISSDELLDQTTVVTYLTSTYYMDYWIRG